MVRGLYGNTSCGYNLVAFSLYKYYRVEISNRNANVFIYNEYPFSSVHK